MITIIILDFIKSCHFILIRKDGFNESELKENARNGTILSIRTIFTLFD